MLLSENGDNFSRAGVCNRWKDHQNENLIKVLEMTHVNVHIENDEKGHIEQRGVH